MHYDDLIKRARDAGYAHGKAAGSWVIDGNTSADTARYLLKGLEDGDPEVYDRLPSSPLSGEWADSPTPASVLADLGVSEDCEGADDLLNEYEDAFSDGVTDEVVRAALYLAAPDVEEVLGGYVECALWASTGDDSGPLDALYTAQDFAPETIAAMRADVEDFLDYCAREGLDLSALKAAQIGHDFWLTRNGHGAGFWDRGLGELGDKLTAMCKPYGESNLYAGDDGRLYVA
jgi:hypothetical protein